MLEREPRAHCYLWCGERRKKQGLETNQKETNDCEWMTWLKSLHQNSLFNIIWNINPNFSCKCIKHLLQTADLLKRLLLDEPQCEFLFERLQRIYFLKTASFEKLIWFLFLFLIMRVMQPILSPFLLLFAENSKFDIWLYVLWSDTNSLHFSFLSSCGFDFLNFNLFVLYFIIINFYFIFCYLEYFMQQRLEL